MTSIINCIIKDISQPVSYLPQGILLSAGVVVVCGLLCRLWPENRVPQILKKRGCIFLFVTYIVVLLTQSFFSRLPGSRNTVSLVLFETWGATAQSHAYVLENILMFLPFGILFPSIFSWKMPGNTGRCVLAALVFSVSLEAVQWATERGHCQLDDVVMNTLGALAGCCLLSLWHLMVAIIKRLRYD